MINLLKLLVELSEIFNAARTLSADGENVRLLLRFLRRYLSRADVTKLFEQEFDVTALDIFVCMTFDTAGNMVPPDDDDDDDDDDEDDD